MASISKEIVSRATPDAVWDAIRDIGALHTRLVPGFVTATELIPEGRRVTFGNGMVVDEPIIGSDDRARRLAWTARGDALPFRHYNASVQVFPHERGSRVVWTADLLPDEAAPTVGAMMDQGMAAMARTLDQLASGPS
jgi:carbon monoxide dehydrogenase subunit G